MGLAMPPARDFGWALKPVESSSFAIHQRPNGQFCVVLNHALLRGVTAEMIHWWFRHFTQLSVMLEDTPGYVGKRVPAYLLWHPSDHISARLSGRPSPDGSARAGASIHIQEAMQYDRFGLKYPVDSTLRIFYVGPDGWAMGKVLPGFGPIMMLRIHFRDAGPETDPPGVHYHYEVVIGLTAGHALARFVNRRLSAKFGPEFFDAWHRHNVIEVGVFENFLPALFAQRHDLARLSYRREMDPAPAGAQGAQDPALFRARLEGYRSAPDPYAFQAFNQPSFLPG